MSLVQFLSKSLRLSISVSLRMIPVILMSMGVVFLIYAIFEDTPLVFFVIIAAVYLPLLVFLMISAVRAGLMGLRQTTPASPKGLIAATIRVMRFNFMLNNVIVGVLGVGSMVLAIQFLDPELLDALRAGDGIESITDVTAIIMLLGQLPAFVICVILVSLSISVAVVGVNVAAAGATAANDGPRHDLLYGLAQQFFPLFLLSAIVLVLPSTVFPAMLGGFMTDLSSVTKLSWSALIILPLYGAWATCAIAAGMAVAYMEARREEQESRVQHEQEMMGQAFDPSDIRALRMARQAQQDRE